MLLAVIHAGLGDWRNIGLGKIPFAGRIKVEGMTVEQAEKDMEDALKKRDV